ncbi:MAG: SGNH/GDSL hydrolase family protein [Nitrospinota bacterium]
MKHILFWRRVLFSFLSAFFILYSPTSEAGSIASFSNVFVFGDSLSDTGNVSAVTGCAAQPVPNGGLIPVAPYEGGRFSNGKVWVEVLADSLGKSVFPAASGGTDFAFGGARSGPSGGIPPAVPSLLDQFAMFSGVTGGIAPNDALYVVWGGANDVRDAVVTRLGGDEQEAQNILDTAVSNITNVVGGLAGIGGQNFLVPNVPDLGLTPEALSGEAGVSLVSTALSQDFNDSLHASLAGVETGPGVNLIELDIFSFLSLVRKSPSTFGFTNVSDPCVNLFSVCKDPSEYLFYDGVHPTAKGHAQIAGLALRHVVAEPELMALLGIALCFLLLRRYFPPGKRVFWRWKKNKHVGGAL